MKSRPLSVMLFQSCHEGQFARHRTPVFARIEEWSRFLVQDSLQSYTLLTRIELTGPHA